MKRLVSFKELKSICIYEYPGVPYHVCDHEKNNGNLRCSSKNCPVWMRLKTVEEKK